MIRLLTLALVGLCCSLAAHADGYDDLIDKACKNGTPWLLPTVQEPFSVSEIYLRLTGPENTPIRVCQCAADVDGKPLHVWVRSLRTVADPAKAVADAEVMAMLDGKTTGLVEAKGTTSVVSLLRGRSCLDVGGLMISVHHSDAVHRRWGTYYNPLPKP